VNLLGTGRKSMALNWSTMGRLHWYGKSENRMGRKMGHINVIDRSPQAALQRALRWQREFKI
jgi:phosphoribosylaminoimidazole carboxylase (NCAIR synthetase)